MKRVLLTGASGFVGRHAVAPLLGAGFEVHAVTASGAGADADARAVWYRADLLDARQSRELVETVKPTHLLHAAWYAVPGKFWTAEENLRWVGASLELFQAFAGAGGRRLVGVGTCAEYDWTAAGEACSESSTPAAPATLYGACKNALRLLLEAFARQAGFGQAWARVFFPYGPHDHAEKLVAYAARSLLTGEPVNATHGRQVRDLLYVEDVGAALARLLDSEAEGVVNVASGEGVALAEVLGRLAALTDGRELLRLGARRAPEGEPPALVADVTRLREEVGFAPAYTLDRGLEATVEWWRQRLAAGGGGAPGEAKAEAKAEAAGEV